MRTARRTTRAATAGFVLTGLAVAAAPSAPVQGQIVRGRLVEVASRRPVALGEMSLLDSAGAAVDRTITNERGAFELVAPGPGDYYVFAQRLGYESRVDGVLEMGEGGFITVTFHIHPVPFALDSLRATVERIRTSRYLDQQGFYRRMEGRSGWFMTPEQIDERPWFDLGSLLQRAPFVRPYREFGGGGSIEMVDRGGGTCAPMVYVDGVPAPQGAINDLVLVEEVHAIEVYRGVAQIPLEWGSLNNGCGVVLIWTKWGSLASGG